MSHSTSVSSEASKGAGTGTSQERQFQVPPSNLQLISKIPNVLPHERVFPIQLGSDLFKLSGLSLSSDAPSYFSQYFQYQFKQAEENGQDINSSAIRTLYIDRDPATFRDISLHLQGYHVQPRNGTHFVRLFSDAQFYSLPKLMSQLYEESIFMSIGHREFQIPRDLLQAPGNSPNFFSLGFAIFFSTPDAVFPGLGREGLVRPPSILPPSVPHRSADVFQELLQLLRGYPLHIRDEEHRASLLRDCRYFNFKGLEQKLIPHHISFNQTRQRSDIVIRLEDILKSGISVAQDASMSMAGDAWSGFVNYARPFEDQTASELVLEIGGESTRLHLPAMRADFFGQVRSRIGRLLEVVATKLNLPPMSQPLGLLMPADPSNPQTHRPLSADRVRFELEPASHVLLDGQPYSGQKKVDLAASAAYPVMAPSIGNSGGHDPGGVGLAGPFADPASRKRRRVDPAYVSTSGTSTTTPDADEWVVRRGQWRLRIDGSWSGSRAIECVLVAVKLDAYSGELGRNSQRAFLA